MVGVAIIDASFISNQAVKWAISELKAAKIHSFFLPYLVLRRHAVINGSTANLQPSWVEEVGKLLEVPGGPPTKPYYRPFVDQDVRDESRYWMNRNLSGSYAPASLRKLAGEVVSGSGGVYHLAENHLQKAFNNLLGGLPVNAQAFAAFLFRDYAFLPEGRDDEQLLIDALRATFQFDRTPEGDKDFRTLFSTDATTLLESHLLSAWAEDPRHQVVNLMVPTAPEELDYMAWERVSPQGSMSLEPLRKLSADDLGIGYKVSASTAHASNDPSTSMLDDNDPLVVSVRRLLDQFGGVLLSGPPGTSKSYYAGLLAGKLTQAQTDQTRFVQLHASYQYEDFMEGFSPKEDGSGFRLKDGHLVDMCNEAMRHPEKTYVLVVDELSRADVGRVFGEALTYVEKSKRGIPFSLPSGRKISVPHNLHLIMTMNPMDKGVDEVDAAFERRFAKIAFAPDADRLNAILESNGVEESLSNRLLSWFRLINKRAKDVPQAAVGHTYFTSVTDVSTLRDVWQYQLQFHLDRAFRYDPATKDDLVAGWQRIFHGVPGGWDGEQTEAAPATSDAIDEQTA